MTQQPALRTRAAGLMLLATLLLAGCQSLPGGGGVTEARADRLLADGSAEQAASAYLALASGAAGIERDRLLLRAATAFVAAGDAARAALAIDRVATPVDPALDTDWRIARAAVANLEDNGTAALAILDGIDMRSVSLAQRIALEGERGTALFLTGEPLEAVATLNRRELWLGDAREIEANHARIRDGLLRADPARLRDGLASTSDRVVAGWLALGLLLDGNRPGGPASGLAAWQRQYPGHPALATIVPGLGGDRGEAAFGEPAQIALLATLSGRAAPVGEAIRDGFLGHYADAQRGRIDAPVVRVYDIADSGATVAYQRAVADGAEFIVGPVLPTAVEELAMHSELTVPTLALNYLREPVGQPLLFQFGLAPEDEAAAVALRAIGDGHRRAVAFAPASNWGERVLAAFNDTFSAFGGSVVDAATYIAEATDYSDEIEAAMLLDDSVTRYRLMRGVVNQPLQFEPRRRADVDFVFMAAAADSGARLRPQLRFHYAGDLPVYATSVINSVGDDSRARDLDGVRFTEIPWLTADMRGESTPLNTVGAALVAARRQPRLFALGYDAWGAVSRVSAVLAGQPVADWSGATGTLSLGPSGDIRRRTDWAVFDGGTTAALPPLDPRVDPSALPRELPLDSAPAGRDDDAPETRVITLQ